MNVVQENTKKLFDMFDCRCPQCGWFVNRAYDKCLAGDLGDWVCNSCGYSEKEFLSKFDEKEKHD